MAEEHVAEDLVDRLPVPCDHALLVQIDKVALDDFWVRLLPPQHAAFRGVLPQLTSLLKTIAKCLKLLHLILPQELFDDV